MLTHVMSTIGNEEYRAQIWVSNEIEVLTEICDANPDLQFYISENMTIDEGMDLVDSIDSSYDYDVFPEFMIN